MGLGAITIGLAVVAVLVWVAVLVAGGRRRAARIEEAPANLRPFLTDDELETNRLNQVLLWALISAAVLAYAVPGYYLGESERQADAVAGFDHRDVEEGETLFNEEAAHGGFECFACHGTGAVGGAAENFVESRSGLETVWAAPALNDIFFRYDEDEVRYWITFGRAGTPMPAWGLDGGGPMNSQQIDQVIAYIRSLQIPQSEAVAQAEGRVARALARVDGGDETVAAAIAGPLILDEEGDPILDAEGNPLRNRTTGQEARVAEIKTAGAAFAAVDAICCGDREKPRQVEMVLTGDDTCTERSAALILTTCARPGLDTDRDGLTDVAEVELTKLLGEAADIVFGPEPTADDIALGVARDVLEEEEKIRISLDPASGFSMSGAAGPIADLTSVEDAVTELKTRLFGLRAVAENTDRFRAGAQDGLEFLEASLAEQRWALDFSKLAADMSSQRPLTQGSYGVDDARRAYGLFNAFCARCHTGGYSAGVAFEQLPGSGALGPSLREGRAAVQFPDRGEHIDFIGKGSENAKPYGINGIGRGWMPGFQFVLSRSDLELIADFERAL